MLRAGDDVCKLIFVLIAQHLLDHGGMSGARKSDKVCSVSRTGRARPTRVSISIARCDGYIQTGSNRQSTLATFRMVSRRSDQHFATQNKFNRYISTKFGIRYWTGANRPLHFCPPQVSEWKRSSTQKKHLRGSRHGSTPLLNTCI
jgi:hypothetical protein